MLGVTAQLEGEVAVLVSRISEMDHNDIIAVKDAMADAILLLGRTKGLRGECHNDLLELKRRAGVRGMADDSVWRQILYRVIYREGRGDYEMEQLFRRGRLAESTQYEFSQRYAALERLTQEISETLTRMLLTAVDSSVKLRPKRANDIPITEFRQRFPRTAALVNRAIGFIKRGI